MGLWAVSCMDADVSGAKGWKNVLFCLKRPDGKDLWGTSGGWGEIVCAVSLCIFAVAGGFVGGGIFSAVLAGGMLGASCGKDGIAECVIK